MNIPELNIEFEDIIDFNDVAGEMLTAFCEDLESKGLSRPVEEDDTEGYNFLFMWKDEAIKLINAETDRLYRIGEKYFGVTLDLDVSTYMYKEL